MLSNGDTLKKLYGCGLGFPTRTKDGMTVVEEGKLKPRADSFFLYMNWVGNKILTGVLEKGAVLA